MLATSAATVVTAAACTPIVAPSAPAAATQGAVSFSRVIDTLSLDYGPAANFAVHYRWLPAGKWGIKGIANLGEVPANGAHVLVGGPKVAGATGGPTRIFALV